MLSKLKLPCMGRTGALVILAVFGALFVSVQSKAESQAYPGPGVYRPNPYAMAGGFQQGRVPVGGIRPGVQPLPGGVPMGGSHGPINTVTPIRAGVRGAVMVRTGHVQGQVGQPCGRPCGGRQARCHRGCGQQRRCGGGGCGGMRCFSISIRFGGGCGGGMRRGGCSRRC